jgi:hypothetical protein
MDKINKKFCSCGSGSVAKIGGYRGFGTTTDYMCAPPAQPSTAKHGLAH